MHELSSLKLIDKIKNICFFRKDIYHLQNAPSFNPNLIDCYIKFTGKIKTENQSTTVLTEKACIFYTTRVSGRKKAAKRGRKKNNKTLFLTEVLAVEKIVLDDGKNTLLISAKDFIDTLFPVRYDVIVPTCPSICHEKALETYIDYRVLEKWCSHLDEVTIYGKLAR